MERTNANPAIYYKKYSHNYYLYKRENSLTLSALRTIIHGKILESTDDRLIIRENHFFNNFLILKNLQGCNDYNCNNFFGYIGFNMKSDILRMLFKNIRVLAFDMHCETSNGYSNKIDSKNYKYCSQEVDNPLCYIELLNSDDNHQYNANSSALKKFV